MATSSFTRASSVSAPRALARQNAPSSARTRCVRVVAAAQHNNNNRSSSPITTAGFAAAAAAALMLATTSAPVSAAPAFNPANDLLAFPPPLTPVGKVLEKLDDIGPPTLPSGPRVEGEFRSNPDKARALAAENSPAGSPAAEAKGAALLPQK